jgi:hypothetical protein
MQGSLNACDEDTEHGVGYEDEEEDGFTYNNNVKGNFGADAASVKCLELKILP